MPDTQPIEPDLEKLRDEKVMPIAQAVLEDMAEGLIPSADEPKASFMPMVMKILKRTLDADLNVQNENSYLFQLLLGVIGNLSSVVQSLDMAPIDDARYGLIAKKILKIVADSNVKMGNLTPEEQVLAFSSVKEQLQSLFVDEKLTRLEVKYLMQTILQSFEIVQTTFNDAVETSVQRMEAKILGIEFISDLSMQKLDETLKAPIPSKEDMDRGTVE